MNHFVPKNAENMSVTLDTSQLSSLPLKNVADAKVRSMVVTLETSHPEISASNDAALSNTFAKLVTALTSHVSMPQRRPRGSSARHASTSAFSASLFAKTLPPRGHS